MESSLLYLDVEYPFNGYDSGIFTVTINAFPFTANAVLNY